MNFTAPELTAGKYTFEEHYLGNTYNPLKITILAHLFLEFCVVCSSVIPPENV